MNTQKYVSEIHTELLKNVDIKFRDGSINFFKEKINPFGVRTNIVKSIAKKFCTKYKNELTYAEFREVCEALWVKKVNGSNLPCMEFGFVAITILQKKLKEIPKEDFYVFEKWIGYNNSASQNDLPKLEAGGRGKWMEGYITNWAHCDIFCSTVVGPIAAKYNLTNETLKWAKSKNRWVKRASAVTYIMIVKDEKYLKNVFKTAEILMKDQDDLVQKGYGWALKKTAQYHKKQTIPFLMKYKLVMPRTAIRYACEKLNEQEKKMILK